MQLNLYQIPYDKCPECGAPAIEATVQADRRETPRIMEHCHGGQWQYLRFACGAYHSATPSPVRINIERVCPKTPKEQARLAARKAAVEHTVSWVRKMADGALKDEPEFVKRLIDNIQNTRVE